MKKWMTGVLFAAVGLLVTACGNEEVSDSMNYDASDYSYTLADSQGNEVDIFTEDEKGLYLYFTGVN
ncbi:hypothetical protein [Salisediminibacterium selenitireducens]|uniref:Uncharacterized protein n=1 Tax=Bacillus selenitireducens (strain ATCC 700615 / DSM 15326 / MLS10) TaxID=439292 RepID=D6XSD0_BACIE|nr:hypothetical protein [Salisediminibacterium selenitireducens]ADH98716.1 hypothetical protein Bsel_1203 [[Bacillus] selenitireducens MLS10]